MEDNSRVVGIDARCGNLGSNAGHISRPGQSWGRCVGAVVVVLIENGLRVAVRSCGSRGGSGGCSRGGSWCRGRRWAA
jgi:hypothetical protein